MSDRLDAETSHRWTIPDSWSWTIAGEIAQIIGGGTPSTTDPMNFEDGEIPWITPADLTGYREKMIRRGERNITEKGLRDSGARIMPAGTVLFSSRAPIGYVAVADNPLATNQGFKSFVPSEAVTSDYLYYYMQFAKPIAKEMASGTTFLEISGAKAAQIRIPIAPLREQQEIVAEIEKQFTRLDAGTAALKRVQTNLKRYRASVLKAACEGRLVPTEAALARKEGRDYEPADKLLHRILRERRARWEADTLAKMQAAGKPPNDDRWKRKYKEPAASDTSKLPKLPEGWCWASVEQISTKVVDGVHQKPNYVCEGVPFITVKNLTAGPGISFEHTNFITPEDHAEFIRRANPGLGDILVSKDGTLGTIRAVRTVQTFSIFVSVAMIKPVILEISDFLELALTSPQVQIQMVPKGSGLQHIHLEDLREDCVPLAPVSEQNRVVAECSRLLTLMDATEGLVKRNLGRGLATRSSILRSAFTGQLVPQDPSDEPASVLLERIRVERSASAASKPAGRSGKEVVRA